MNVLDLPPRRRLPTETRERVRRALDTGIAAPRPRSRIPVAAAAAVVLLAVGAVLVARWAPGAHEERRPATTAPATTNPARDPVVPPLTMTLPGARTHDDLDRCGGVAAASPRAAEFAPRAAWRPEFTVMTPGGARVTAFWGKDGKPAFCEVTGTTATVSDPTAGGTPVAATPDGLKPAAVLAVYLSPTGVLAGVAQGVHALEFSLLHGLELQPVGAPAFRQGLFAVNLGELRPGDSVDVIGRNSQGMSVVSGMVPYDPAIVPPPGASGPVG